MRRLLTLTLFVALPGTKLRADDVDKKPAAVPFELLKSQHMAVQVKINGKGPYRLIFDTGAPVTLLSNKVAKEAGVFPKNYRPSPFAIFGAAQKQFKIEVLEMGALKVPKVDTMVMDHPTVGALATVLGPIEGIVGFNVFAKHRTTIDYQSKTMTFVPVKYEPADMMKTVMAILMAPKSEKDKARILAPGGLLGLRVEKNAGDEDVGVTVGAVFAEGAAAKGGLKAGDRLLTLDGRWTDSVEDCFYAASRLQPGRVVSAEILRDGKKITLQIAVRAGV